MKLLVHLIMIIMLYSSSAVNSSSLYGDGIVVYASLLALFIPLLFLKKVNLLYERKLVGLIFFFMIIGMFSSIINSDLNIFFSALGYFVLFASASVVVPSYFKESTIKVLIVTILMTHLPVLLLPIISNGIDTQPYRGVFDNPNALGGAVTTVFVVVLAIFMQKFEMFLYSKEKQSGLKLISLFIVLDLLFLLVIMTGSRTSFIASVIALLIGGLFLLLFTIKKRLVGNLIIKTTFLLPIACLMLWITNKFIPIRVYAENIIFSKFDRKSNDIFAGRDWVWEKTLNDSGLFGNGSDYFSLEVGLGAHNTFISILGQYGWIAMTIFIVLILFGLGYCIIYALSENQYKYLPLLMVITFLALSMGEVMLYKLSMIASFILIGAVANNQRLVIKQ